MTQEEAEYYAYMNYDTASTELKETIMAARNQIIYSQSWVADGFECYIIAPDGTQEKVATFSELFPDWEMPIVDTDDAAVTPDGLGTNEQYGVFVKVMGIENDYMICQATSTLAPFEEGQSIRVYFPVNYDASCIEKGKNMMVSFYGRDCNRADGTIYANEITVTVQEKAWAAAEAAYNAKVEAAKEYAYRDISEATPAEKAKIMDARNTIIYSQGWVADGYELALVKADGTVENMPKFSELFPDWDIPVLNVTGNIEDAVMMSSTFNERNSSI